VQDLFGYIPRDALPIISERLLIPLNELYGVATFYPKLHFAPQGQHVVRVCDGTSCHVCGGPRILDAAARALGVEPGGTSDDMKFTLEVVHCLGACGLSPVAVIDGKVLGRVRPERLTQQLQDI